MSRILFLTLFQYEFIFDLIMLWCKFESALHLFYALSVWVFGY